MSEVWVCVANRMILSDGIAGSRWARRVRTKALSDSGTAHRSQETKTALSAGSRPSKASAVTVKGSMALLAIRRCICPKSIAGRGGVMSREAHPMRSISVLLFSNYF